MVSVWKLVIYVHARVVLLAKLIMLEFVFSRFETVYVDPCVMCV